MLPQLEDVDRTRAFTNEEQEQIDKLPSAKRLAYMARPNSTKTMSKEERMKHYQSKNYPQIKYHGSGGGGAGSTNPPHMRGLK